MISSEKSNSTIESCIFLSLSKIIEVFLFFYNNDATLSVQVLRYYGDTVRQCHFRPMPL